MGHHPTPTIGSMLGHGTPMISSVNGDRVGDGRSRADSASSGSRHQLPPLSSLFGPPTPRHVPQSPIVEQHGSYTAASPLDRARLASSHSHVPQSYFPTASSPSERNHRPSYDGRTQPERSQFHGFSRSFSGPDPHRQHLSHSNQHTELDSRSTWPPSVEEPRLEYHPTSRDILYQPQKPPFRLQFSKDAMNGHQEQRPEHQPTPASSAPGADGVTVKDGLGPKIWTGTHFLPRFVRAAEVPGEGMCYFYDDGTHCKTVIDGEAVNAHWGVTKAGKPRKRLAIACMTCREKKIKCDPDYPRCVQCEKFGRICKFKNAPRGGHNTSPTSPPAELVDDYRRIPAAPKTHGPTHPRSRSASPSSPRTMPIAAQAEEGSPNKRMRIDTDQYAVKRETHTPRSPEVRHHKATVNALHQDSDPAKIPEEVLDRAWRNNPFLTDPYSTRSAVAQFFTQIESTGVLRLLPEEVFTAWMSDSKNMHTREDLMLLYSILAVGTVLSGRSLQIANEHAQVAAHAQRTLESASLQLVQCRVLLTLYYRMTTCAWGISETICAAVAAATVLQLNVELDASKYADTTSYPLGMNRHGFAEARRRTYWSLFVMDRLDSICQNRPILLNVKDASTRFPSDRKSLEMQEESHMPFFEASEQNTKKLVHHEPSSGAYLVEVVHVWAKCQYVTQRILRQRCTTRPQKLADLEARLRQAQQDLPDTLAFNTKNVQAHLASGDHATLPLLHIMFLHAMMTLNQPQLPRDTIPLTGSSRLEKCQTYAGQVLSLVLALETPWKCNWGAPKGLAAVFPVTVIQGLDILCTEGRVSQLPSLIESATRTKEIFDSVGEGWGEWKDSREIVERQIKTMERIRSRGSQPSTPNDDYQLVHESDSGRRWVMNDMMVMGSTSAKGVVSS